MLSQVFNFFLQLRLFLCLTFKYITYAFFTEFLLSHMDEFIDELLHEERVCDIILPRIQKRQILEETEQLDLRVCILLAQKETDQTLVRS